MAESEAHRTETHEPGSIAILPVVVIAAAFVLFAAISAGLLYFYYAANTKSVPLPDPRPFPKPALEATPLLDLQTLQKRQKALLTGYAWVNQSQGIFRIPIERAEQLIAARGGEAFDPIPQAAQAAPAANTPAPPAQPSASPKPKPASQGAAAPAQPAAEPSPPAASHP